MSLQMDEAALTEFLAREFPQVAEDFRVEAVEPNFVRVRLLVADRHMRPGNTVSGPSMFALADVSVYLAVLAMIGAEALSVTTSVSMDFMRKPGPCDMIAEARLLKLGRVLAVGDVLLYSEGQEPPVARASMTYSVPPRKAAAAGLSQASAG